jgi:hypothetical protein
MQNKTLSFVVPALILILNACSPFTIASSSAGQPTPVVESIPATGYQPLSVDHVEVEIGIGSPIPVHVNVSGNLPDTCAQVEYTEIKRDGSNFNITLSTNSSTAEGCVQDPLPFKMSIPLNIVNLPAGPYEVNVNGVTTSFDPRAMPSLTESTPASTPIAAKIPAPSFEAKTYINEEVGFAMEYPAQWTVSEDILGDRGSQVQFLSSPKIVDVPDLPEGATRINITVYQWEPKNDLAAYVAHWKQAWASSGFTIQEEETFVLEGGLDAVQVILQTPDAKVAFLVTAIGERYLVVSGEGDLGLVKEALRTVRAISGQ